MTNHIINVPADTLVAGLRQRRDELAEQLARLDRTRQTVESDLDALEQAIQVVGNQRNRAAAVVTTPPAVSPVALAATRGDTVGHRRGDLSAAVRQALSDYGPLMTAEIVGEIRERVSADLATINRVSACLCGLAAKGAVTGTAVSGTRGKRWALTEPASEGGAA